MEETKEISSGFDIDKVRKYADEEEKKGGFVLCFRGEVPTKKEKYTGVEAAGTWYSEMLSEAVRTLKDRERSSDEAGAIFSVVIPRSWLDSRGRHDSASFMINIWVPQILESRKKLSSEEVEGLLKEQSEKKDTTGASKDDYLRQFEAKDEKGK
jgi:hypothetical protein